MRSRWREGFARDANFFFRCVVLDRVISICGIALGLICFAAPLAFPHLPAWVAPLSFYAGFFLIGLAVGLYFSPRWHAPEVAKPVNTVLRLQFFGDERIPTSIHEANIANWYVLWTPSATISLGDSNGNSLSNQVIVPKNWTIFVLFEKKTVFREFIVSFASPGLPPYEVKARSDRFAIVNISGDIPFGVLEVFAKV